MGLEGGSDDDRGVVSAAQVNQATYEQALAAAPQLFKDTYQARGKQLAFGPDRDVSSEIKSPVDWMNMPLSFEPGGWELFWACQPARVRPGSGLVHSKAAIP